MWQPEALLERCPKALKEQMKTCYFKPGDYLMKIGDPAIWVYMMVEGEVKIYHATESGIDIYPYIGLYNDEMFGELEAVLGGDRFIGSNVQAKTKAIAVKMPSQVFLQWLEVDKEFNKLILKRFAKWVRMLAEYSANSASLSLRVRMAKMLEEQIASHPDRPVSKAMICGVLATSMRSTNRIVKQLKEEGVIAVSGDDIRVLNPALLRKVAKE